MEIKLKPDDKFILYDDKSGQPIIIDTIIVDEVCKLGQIVCYGTRIWVNWDETDDISKVIQELSRVQVNLDYNIRSICDEI